MTLDTCNHVTSEQLSRILSIALEARWAKADDRLPAIMVWGPPGVGKSAIVKQVAEDHHCEFIDLRLAQMEAIDIKGLPMPEKDGVHWKISSTYPREPKSRGILFLDELSACDRTIQTAAYELILDRRLGTDYTLPEGWQIVAAGNRIEDGASAVAMSSALANRFLHVELSYDARSWCDWAVTHGLHGAVIGLIRFKHQLLADMDDTRQNLERGFPTPRAWERVSVWLQRLGSGAEDAVLRPLVCGLVGNSAGTELISFYHLFDKMESVVKLMMDPEAEVKIPSSPEERYAFTAALTWALWKEEAGEEKERIAGFYRISMNLPADFAVMAMADGMNNCPAGQTGKMALIRHPAYQAWLKKFGPGLRGSL